MTKRFDLSYWLPFLILAAIILVAAPLAFFGGASMMTITTLLKDIALSMLMAVSLSMVVGYLGELSIGHAAFMCVGALMGGKLSLLIAPALGSGLLALIVCMLAGGLLAALFGFAVGLPALRLRGDYLAIVTLAFNEIICKLIPTLPSEWFGGASSFKTPLFKGFLIGNNEFFIIVLLVVALCIAFSQNLIRSKHGRAIQAIRDNEIAARATGINVGRYKLIVFVAAAFFAGLAGVLSSFGSTTVDASTMDFNKSIDILIMVVLGGMGNISGVMLSATLITLLNNYISIPINALTGGLGAITLGDLSLNLNVLPRVIYALILIVLMIYRNSPSLKIAREAKKAQKAAKKQVQAAPVEAKEAE